MRLASIGIGAFLFGAISTKIIAKESEGFSDLGIQPIKVAYETDSASMDAYVVSVVSLIELAMLKEHGVELTKDIEDLVFISKKSSLQENKISPDIIEIFRSDVGEILSQVVSTSNLCLIQELSVDGKDITYVIHSPETDLDFKCFNLGIAYHYEIDLGRIASLFWADSINMILKEIIDRQ